MKRFSVVLILLLAIVTASAEDTGQTGQGEKKKKRKVAKPPEHTLLYRMFHVFSHPEAKDETSVTVGANRLSLTMAIDPPTLKLSETHQFKVTLLVANKTKRFVQLDFPTTQRIEVLVKDAHTGKLVEQWSEDRSFTNEPGMVSINPGERLEYSAVVATRDMAAGGLYEVEAFFPNHETLRARKTFTPEK